MTAHELARLLLEGPDIPVMLIDPEWWEGDSHLSPVIGVEVDNGCLVIDCQPLAKQS